MRLKKRTVLVALAAALLLLVAANWPSSATAATPAPAAELPWRPSDAYAQHPLVTAARQGPGLPVAVCDALFSERLSADRALAAVDALSAEGFKTHEVDKVLLAAIARQAGASRGPVDLPEQLAAAALTPKQALLLGWLRARIEAARPEALLRRGDQLGDAGAVQLLDQAVAQEPGWQVANLALQVARWVAQPQQRNCAQLQKIVAAAREPGQLPLALPAAQAAIDLALRLDKATPLCPAEVRQDWVRPLQLPPPAPEDYRPPGVRPPPPTTPRGHPELDALLFAAPVFRGWIAQPLVKSMVLRTPLMPVPLAASLDADPTGDTALAAVNASLYNDRTPISDHVVVAWEALLVRRGMADADREQQDHIAVRDLAPVEAAVLGYARALAGPISGPTDPAQPARLAPAEALFDRARGGLPAQAQLGPLWALALPIEPLRARDSCAAARRAEALRVVVQKSALPQEAQQAMVSALQIVERACPPPPEPTSAPK